MDKFGISFDTDSINRVNFLTIKLYRFVKMFVINKDRLYKKDPDDVYKKAVKFKKRLCKDISDTFNIYRIMRYKREY